MSNDDRNLKLGNLALLVILAHVSQASATSLFEDNSVLEVNLSGPLSSLFDEESDSEELPFDLRASDIEFSVRVKVRGKSRRRLCSFPPLRLTFSEADTVGSIFQGEKKLKLVTHCRERKSAQSDTLQEYLAYRIFNLISDVSYRVRLLRINYSDTDGELGKHSFDHYGFLIESETGLAERIGGRPAHVTGVSLATLNTEHAAAVFVFQYLIGNTDWSLVTANEDNTCCHNGDLFDVGSVRHYVPYDFDLSGLVNAHYARPDSSLRISKVTQRKYRGYCISTDALKRALGTIRARRVDILNLIEQLPGVPQKDVKETQKYLEQFFVRASDENKLLRSFERKCL